MDGLLNLTCLGQGNKQRTHFTFRIDTSRAGCRAVRDSTLVAWYRFFTHLAREGRMTVPIGRRKLLAALGGAAVEWPLAARAQPGERMRRVA